MKCKNALINLQFKKAFLPFVICQRDNREQKWREKRLKRKLLRKKAKPSEMNTNERTNELLHLLQSSVNDVECV